MMYCFRSRLCWLASLALLFAAGGRIQAQLANGMPVPNLTSIAPTGGIPGETLELTFTGQDTEEPKALLFSHPGLSAESVFTPSTDPKKPATFKAFKVRIARDVPLGIYDVRVSSRWGVSNPRAFVVSDLPVVAEKESNDDVPAAQRLTLPCIVSGVIASPTDVDYFVFNAPKGKRILAFARTASIDSRLLASLELFDSAGKLLASRRPVHRHDTLLDFTAPAAGDYYLRVTEFTHTVGGPEYRYHLAVGDFPYIDAVFPLAVEPGKKTKLTLTGRNLPDGKLDPALVDNGAVLEEATIFVEPPAQPNAGAALTSRESLRPAATLLPTIEVRVKNAAGSSNAAPVLLASAPIVPEWEPNDSPATAQPISVPCEISGRLDRRGDHDWFTFKARKGEVFQIELWSDRLDASTDLKLSVHEGAGKQTIVGLDDDGESLDQVFYPTRSQDPPAYQFTASKDGVYHIRVRGPEGDKRFGIGQFYHLRVLPEIPDFQLVAIPGDEYRPASATLHRGGHVRWRIFVQRSGGWKGPIELQVEGLPAGVIAPKQFLSADRKSGSVVLSSTLDAPPWTGQVIIRGRAEIGGKTVVREAIPASVMVPITIQGQTKPNQPAVVRVERNLALAVRERAPFTVDVGDIPATIEAGTKVDLPLQITRLAGDFKAPIQIGPADGPEAMPPGIAFTGNQQGVTAAPDKDAININLDVRSFTTPGNYTVVLKASAPYAVTKDVGGKPTKQNITAVFAVSPITFKVVPKPPAPPAAKPAAPPAAKPAPPAAKK